jgi:hypothetical protein
MSTNKALENKILEGQLQLKAQELQYLKKQIHPHFLFNTLNTIYSFALKQSKQTPEVILKLSNLLDYILYQVQKPTVSLKEELLHIQEYVDLEAIRFQDTLVVDFSTQAINDHMQIPPMLLIPFVENAFKHGRIINGQLAVSIQAKFHENHFIFQVVNTFRNDIDEINQGIGLENIRKRLSLLYQKQYDLVVSSNKEAFEIILKIPKEVL